jgi:hypothetical protein
MDSLCGLGRTHPLYGNRERITGRPSNYNVALNLAIFGISGSVLVSGALIWIRVIRVAHEQVLSILCLLEVLEQLGHPAALTGRQAEGTPSNDDRSWKTRKLASQWASATERVFKWNDLDDSGAIDFKELRLILQRMYPHAHGTLLRHAMMQVRPYADTDGELDVVAFQDARCTDRMCDA